MPITKTELTDEDTGHITSFALHILNADMTEILKTEHYRTDK